MRKRNNKYSWLLLLLLGLGSCSGNLLDVPKSARGNASFLRYVAVGSTETSGFADGALYKSGQEHSYAALLAQQFALTGLANFNQPLYTNDDGVGIFNGHLAPKLVLGNFVDCSGNTMFIPIRKPVTIDTTGFNVSGLQPFNNLGIPSATTEDMVDNNLYQQNIFYKRMHGDSAGRVMDDIKGNPPTFFTVWLGTQDVLNYAINGGQYATLPSALDFRMALDSILDAATADSSAGGVIANIPDVMEYPFFNTVAYNGLPLDTNLAALLNNILGSTGFRFTTGNNPFLVVDSSVNGNERFITENERVVMTIPIDSIRCQYLGTLNPLTNQYFLTTQEIANIENAIDAYNQVIADEAATRNIPLVDLKAMFHKLKSGIQYNGVLYTNVLVTGNFFSLDGLNPGCEGHALIANEFIKKINSQYKASIPQLDPTKYNGPLFP